MSFNLPFFPFCALVTQGKCLERTREIEGEAKGEGKRERVKQLAHKRKGGKGVCLPRGLHSETCHTPAKGPPGT